MYGFGRHRVRYQQQQVTEMGDVKSEEGRVSWRYTHTHLCSLYL